MKVCVETAVIVHEGGEIMFSFRRVPQSTAVAEQVYLRRAPKLSYLYDRIWDPKVTAAGSVYLPHRSGNTLKIRPFGTDSVPATVPYLSP